MWTVCWIDSGGFDMWDRFRTQEDVLRYLVSWDLQDDEDVLIIPPHGNEVNAPMFTKDFIKKEYGTSAEW